MDEIGVGRVSKTVQDRSGIRSPVSTYQFDNRRLEFELIKEGIFQKPKRQILSWEGDTNLHI